MAVADPYLAVEGALDHDARELLRERVLKLNPGLRGAAVADILSMMDDSDAFLAVREPYWTEHGSVLAAELGPGGRELVAAAACAAVILLDVMEGASAPPDPDDPVHVAGNFPQLVKRLAQAAFENETHAVTVL